MTLVRGAGLAVVLAATPVCENRQPETKPPGRADAPPPAADPEVPPTAPRPPKLTLPDVPALRSAATAAAHKGQLTPKPFTPGAKIGAVQRQRKRMPWTTVLYKGVDDRRAPYLVDKVVTYFAEQPAAKLSAAGELTVGWRTRTNAPGGIVYLGMRVEEDPLAAPRYREYGSEKLRRPARAHTMTIGVERLLKARYDTSGVRARGYGEIEWQVEQFVPEVATTVVHGGRTAFRRDGDVFIQQPTIVIGPLVHQVKPESFIVSFETDVPTGAAVAVGDRLPKVSPDVGTRHEILVDGLKAGTRYAYQVGASDGIEASVAPPREVTTRSASGPVTVAIMSDSRSGIGAGLVLRGGVNEATLRPLLTSAHRHGAQAVFFAGDLINGYSTHPDDYDYELRTWLGVASAVGGSLPIYTGMGNHESLVDQWSDGVALARSRATSAEERFAALMVNPGGAPGPERSGAPPYAETVYSVDIGPVHFVMLNTNYWYSSHPGHERYIGHGNREGMIMDGQLRWLSSDLEAAVERKVEQIVVIGHEPAFPAGGHTKDAMWWHGKIPEVNAMREAFWKLLAEHGVLAYVSGDEHNYSRGLIGPETVAGAKASVYSVITGGCGAPYYSKDPPEAYADRIQAFSAQQHYTLWTFAAGKPARLRAVGITGELIDDVELTEAGAP